jgi:hypothetical protein
MRTILLSLPALLPSCMMIETQPEVASQRDILKQSQAVIASHEPWSRDAAIFVVQKPDALLYRTWKVKAGAFDFSDYPSYKGTYFVRGTERELRFTSKGCLISYSYAGNPCLTTVVSTDTREVLLVPAK